MKSFILFLILSSQCAFAQNLVLVFLHHRTDTAELPKEQADKIMEGHFANIKKMTKEGKLLVAGPFEGGGGIFIFNSTSVEEVSNWLKTDPGIQAERWKVEIQLYQWRVGQPKLVSEPIEMTLYNFIRYVPYIAKFNINDVPELLKKHDDYMKDIIKTGNVVAEGTFGDSEGSILVIKGDLDQKVIDLDPAVREGLLEIDIKVLYVAKGAFGER